MASRGDEWPLLRGHNMILILRSTGPYSFVAKSFPHLRSVSGSPLFAVSTSHFLSGVVRARNKMQRGTWLVERRCPDKPKVVTRHSGVSYACLLVPVVRHSPHRGRASALGKGRSHMRVSAESHLHVSAELLAANTDEGTSRYHHEVPSLPDCSDEVSSIWVDF